MEQIKDARGEFERINEILSELTPEGREAWLKKGADMVNTIRILEAGGYQVVKAEGRA